MTASVDVKGVLLQIVKQNGSDYEPVFSVISIIKIKDITFVDPVPQIAQNKHKSPEVRSDCSGV